MIAPPTLTFTVAAFLAAIAVLVVVHEFGHYSVGRLFGVRVEAFSVGFGRELLGWTDGRGTRWKLGWLPLGGYVRFAGDMNPASVPAVGTTPADPGTFQGAALWKRALIVVAGPAINLAMAVAIYMAIFASIGVPRAVPVVNGVQNGSVAAAAGFRVGDRIVAVDGTVIDDFADVMTAVRLRPEAHLVFKVQRGDKLVELAASPKAVIMTDRFGNRARIGQLGIVASAAKWDQVAPGELPRAAAAFAWTQTKVMVEAFVQLVRGERSLDDLGGPVKIAKITGEQATLGLLPLLFLVAALSLNLAFINLLPIPTLDGGHLLMYLVEAVRRRSADPQMMDWAFRGGLALVLTFFVFVTVNDVTSLFR